MFGFSPFELLTVVAAVVSTIFWAGGMFVKVSSGADHLKNVDENISLLKTQVTVMSNEMKQLDDKIDAAMLHVVRIDGRVSYLENIVIPPNSQSREVTNGA